MMIHFESVCRCCLRSGALESIFNDITERSEGSNKMIEYLCSIPVTKNDGLSTLICLQCSQNLHASYKFKQKCIESYTKLLNLKEQTCPTIKLEPKLEEFEFDADEASQCKIIVEQLKYLQHKNNDSDENIENEINENNQTYEAGTKDEVDTNSNDFDNDKANRNDINENSNISKAEVGNDGKISHYLTLRTIPVKNIKEKKNEQERKQYNKATSKAGKSSHESKIKKRSGKLTCDICGKTFCLLNRLRDHIVWVHEGKRPYHCLICDKGFKNEKQHRETHEGIFSATCDKCGKKFVKQKTYMFHMESHENNEYKCKCGKTFKVRNSFLTHKRFVHGPKNYVCHCCPKAFTQKESLNNHIRTHSEERPFECEICGMKFRMKKTRLGHIKMKHSDVRPYKCKVCDKDFKTRSILVKHTAIHEERRFACRICNQPFGRSDNRNVHERSVHRILKEEVKTMGPA